MKVKRGLGILLIGAMLVTAALGCAPKQPVQPGSPTPTGKPTPAPTTTGNWPSKMYIGVASGTSNYMGIAVTDILNKNVPGIQVSAEPTSGTDEMVMRIANGKSDMGNLPAAKIWQGLVGEKPFDTIPRDAIRTLFLSYHTLDCTIVRANSGIKSHADLRGKRIALGGPTHEELARVIWTMLSADGISEKDMMVIPRLTTADDVQELVENKVDVIIITGGVPVLQLAEAMKTTPMTILPVTPQEAAAAASLLYFPAVMPAGTYPGQDKDVLTLSAGRSHFAIRKDLPDDLVPCNCYSFG